MLMTEDATAADPPAATEVAQETPTVPLHVLPAGMVTSVVVVVDCTLANPERISEVVGIGAGEPAAIRMAYFPQMASSAINSTTRSVIASPSGEAFSMNTSPTYS